MVVWYQGKQKKNMNSWYSSDTEESYNSHAKHPADDYEVRTIKNAMKI